MPKLTHQEFLYKLETKFPNYTTKFTIVSNYKASVKPIFVLTKYGMCTTIPNSLLNGYGLDIRSALNKTEYFKNVLSEHFPNYNLYYKVLHYQNRECVYVQDMYGILTSAAGHLKEGKIPSIRKAVNKVEYTINRLDVIHENKYNYKLFKEYVNNTSKISVICPRHDEFKISLVSHLSQKSGCIKCMHEDLIGGKWYGDFTTGSFYIIECWNNTERFYKVGLTKTTVRERYSSTYRMPYNYKINFIYKNENSKMLWEIEQKMIKLFKKYHYKPKIKFGGSARECIKLN